MDQPADREWPPRALTSALAGGLGDDVAAAIAAARAEACGRLRAMLVEVMLDEMVREAGVQLRPHHPPPREPPARPRARDPTHPWDKPAAPPPPVPAHPSDKPAAPPPPDLADPLRAPAPAEAADHELGFYVYGVVRAGLELPAGLPAVDPDHSPTLLRHDRLAAAVSLVPLSEFGEERLREHLTDMVWLERTARTHEQVLEAIGREMTLIPMRLCSIYRTADGVRDLLAREAGALERALDHLAGKSEWGVKVFADLARGVRDPQDEAAEAEARTGSGTDYMRQRQHARDARRSAGERMQAMCAEIHDRIRAVVDDALVSPPQRPEVSGHPGDMVLNGVYLVRDDQEGPFLAAVDALRDEYGPAGLDLEPTGPWPAYNFVPGTIGAAW